MATLVVVVVVVLAVSFIRFDDFSIIGQREVSANCRMNEDCDFNLTLPSYRTLDSYTLDLSFSSVPGEVEGFTTVQPVSNRGSYRDQWVTSSNVLREETYYWFYFYRIPENWDLDEIYSIYVESEVSGSERRSSSTARFFAYNNVGFLTINQTSNTVQTCGDVRLRDYPMCVIQSFTDRWNGISEIRTWWVHIVWFSNDLRPGEYNANVENPTIGNTNQFTINYEGYILINDFLEKHSITRDGLMLVNMVEKTEFHPNLVTSSLSPPPTLRMGYTKSVKPSNVQLFVGNELVQTIDEADNVTTVDLASYINNYCERDTSVDDCVVPFTLKSSTDGVIKIHSEEGVLRAQPFQRTDIPTISEPVEKKDRFRFKDFIRSDLFIYLVIGIMFLLVVIIIWYKRFRK